VELSLPQSTCGLARSCDWPPRANFQENNKLRLQRLQAAAHLGISVTTLDRWIKSGKLQAERGELTSAGKPTVWVVLPDSEPESFAPTALPQPKAEVKPEPLPAPTEDELQREADLKFAEAYRAGLVTDSFGNTIFNTDERRTAIGPQEPEVRSRPGTTDHMVQALLPKPSFDEKGDHILHAGSDNAPLVRAAIARGDIRAKRATPLGEQRRKSQQDIRAMAAAWQSGFSR
jgi:hypothetical protein